MTCKNAAGVEACGCAKGAEIPVTAMTLRDHFAACALTGILAAEEQSRTSPNWLAEVAYDIADGMLAERAKGGAQ